MPSKHALIIGINKYPYMEAKYQLRGCVNDAKLIRNTLINKFNFERSNIAELHDKAATRDGILTAMNGLLKRVKKNDIVVFHYSGHGHRCTSKTKFTDEGSGKDNCLLPHDDSKPKADGKPDFREIRDDRINQWLQKLAAKTGNITLIFDACHSGTMTRSADNAGQARSIPESVRRQPAPARGSKSAPAKRPTKRAARKGAGGWLTLNDNYVVIAGCRDMQTSKERWFSEGDMQYRHGVLTYSLIGALNNAQPGTTYRDLFEQICSKVPAAAADQNPQIEGRIDRELFGVKDIEPMRYLPVSEVKGKKITIDGGAAHGLEKGSRWSIYPAGTKVVDGAKPVDSAKIVSVGATRSIAKIPKTNPDVVTGCRAVEADLRVRCSPMLVYLGKTGGRQIKPLNAAVKKSRLLRRPLRRGSADVYVTLAKANSSKAIELALQYPDSAELLKQSDCWVFFYNDGTPAFRPHAVSERAVATVLVENLEKIARFRRVLALQNNNTELKVSFNLYKRSGKNKLTLANGGGAEFKEGDHMVFEITNNETDRPVFFSLIWLSANLAIDHFYPRRKSSEEISPGKTVWIGEGERRVKTTFSPDAAGDTVVETCKLMVTTGQSDFRWLNQTGTRSNASASSSLKEFDLAMRGGGTKHGIKARDDWSAINRSMVIKSAGKRNKRT